MRSDAIRPNSESFERDILIHPSGFREYDARWLYPTQINPRGFIRLGQCLGTLAVERHGRGVRMIVGHDYREYSAEVKHALALGLIAAGVQVVDIGLALSPVAYFAQFEYDAPGVAMVTASHNENGWTGVKMGLHRPLTFGPKDMADLRGRVAAGQFTESPGGGYESVDDTKERYITDLTDSVGGRFKRKLKVVVACGNGTAGAYAPELFLRVGCEVIEHHCSLDYQFPHYNPNPEDIKMLHDLGATVRAAGADIGFGFDGDGDRCGVVDHQGAEIYADKMGVMLARFLSSSTGGNARRFIADMKSSGLYAADPVLRERNVVTEYWITGHAYMKHRLNETGAVAAFEKSGHFFFGPPLGRGYDDGLFSALQICRILDAAEERTLAELYSDLPQTWLSPTMHRTCADDQKYILTAEMTALIQGMADTGAVLAGQKIISINTTNGVRVTVTDGTWGLFRASSNKPEIVIVVESPISEDRMFTMFHAIEALIKNHFPDIGEYDQKISRNNSL